MVTDLEYIEKMLKEHQERIDARFDSFEKIADSIERRTDERFTSLEKYLILKIDSDKCDECSVNPRVKKLEARVEKIYDWKNIWIGVILIIGFLAPYLMPKLIALIF